MKQLLVLSALLLSSMPLFAQTNLNKSFEKPATEISFAALYNSDASYYGQTSAEKLPYVLLNGSISFAKHFSVSASAYKLTTMGSGISGFDLGASYDVKISPNFSGGISYSHAFYPDNSLLLQSANLNTLSLSLGYDWEVVSSSFTTDFSPGKESALFLSLNIAKSMDLGNLFDADDYILFEPAFILAGGTQRITTYEAIPVTPHKNARVTQILQARRNSNPQYRAIENTDFGILSYNLKLPVSYNRDHYALEATYQATLPGVQAGTISAGIRSFFTMGFYYTF